MGSFDKWLGSLYEQDHGRDECILSDEAGIFRVSIHDESGDGGIFSQSAAKPNCAPVVSGLGSENLA